ncbi:MAG TPA: DUF3500 domain-containing protein [Geminicoccaceae bacterium]|nr:DUF3500 domain-containing protein [Geminicoccaceae bacterium]
MATITKTREPMAEGALAFLESLGGRREAALYPLARDVHRDLHYTPRQGRPGLPLKRMDAAQRELVSALLAGALSAQGLRKTREIIRLEGILGELTGRPDFRDPENYALAIFGDPAGRTPWAWRFEGHHVSLTFTVAPGLGIAVTPSFLGANPAEVPPRHARAGLRVLAVEQDLALALLHDLSGAQRQTAILQPQSFRDILTGPGREASLRRPQGLALAAMTPAQRDRTLVLVEAYVRNMRADLAEQELRALHEAGPEKLHFAWAGATERGTCHYYRLHGPTLLVEYDNTEPNHTHTVWHNPRDNFGEDLLRRHHETAHG